VELTEEVAERYARLRAELEGCGAVIGGNDLWIAATALAHGATLVTNNTGEFSRVPGLTIEDWDAAAVVNCHKLIAWDRPPQIRHNNHLEAHRLRHIGLEESGAAGSGQAKVKIEPHAAVLAQDLPGIRASLRTIPPSGNNRTGAFKPEGLPEISPG